jgi:hypothetical protein
MWFGPPVHNTLRPREKIILLCVCGAVQAFYSCLDSYIVSRARQVAPGWLNPYIVGHYQLELANDVSNGMEYDMSYHHVTSHSVRNMASCCQVVTL